MRVRKNGDGLENPFRHNGGRTERREGNYGSMVQKGKERKRKLFPLFGKYKEAMKSVP